MGEVVSCSCGQSFRASDALAGKRVNCPACGGVIAVPNRMAASTGSSTPVLVRCSGCGGGFSAQGHLAGQTVCCPQCGGSIEVPLHATAAASRSLPEDGVFDTLPAESPALGAPQAMATRGRSSPSSRARRKQEFDTEKLTRFLVIPLGIGVILFGIGGVVKGIATWDAGLAADKTIGFGVGGIIVGGIMLAFLAFGGKIR